VPVERLFGTDFSAMVEAMRLQNIEMPKFGPYANMPASKRADAEAIVQGAHNRFAPTYKSCIITRADTSIETVADLAGRNFGFVDPGSASGYLFPLSHLLELEKEAGVKKDNIDKWFGNVLCTGGHDASVRAVISGDIEAAAVSGSQIIRMHAAEVEGIEDIVIVSETAPIPRSPEAVRGDLPETLKAAIAYAYLSFNDEDFLTSHNYQNGFISVADSDYAWCAAPRHCWVWTDR
jgi:phosphonate transport system substrate-binding protein